MTNETETVIIAEWLEYIHASIEALATFKRGLEGMATNGNREHTSGEFLATLRNLNDVIGNRYADEAPPGLDALHDVLTGMGLPVVPICANIATSAALKQDIIFGDSSTVVLECKFMPPEKTTWGKLAPVTLRVRREHMRDDITGYYLRFIWAKNSTPCAVEIRASIPCNPAALAYWALNDHD